MVLRAGDLESPGAGAALEILCSHYWYPVYAWIRGAGHSPDDAKDIAQEFFAALLRRKGLGTVDPQRGRFRTFIIRSLKNLLVDQHRMQTAAKRGGGASVVAGEALDCEEHYAHDASTSDSPDVAFDRRWGQTIVVRAMERLEAEQTAAGRETVYITLAGFVGHEPDPGEYEAAARTLGASVNSVAVIVRRLRLRCRELIMEEIMHTVQTRSEAEAELRSLFGK